MRDKIGHYISSINTLKLEERMLHFNTLIIGEQGAGKTNLACRIRNFVIDNDVPTIYMDFSNSSEDKIELRYKDEYFNYIQFEESDEFDTELNKLIQDKKHIYMAVNPAFFSFKKDVISQLSHTLQKPELLENYYYFFHDIENLNGFYTKFEDFLIYMLGFLNRQKFGLTFLAQPHDTFAGQQIKLLFTFLYIGKCSNLHYYNTAKLKSCKKNAFIYQYRTPFPTPLFSDIKTNIVKIDEYVFQE